MVALGALGKGRQRLDETLSFSEGQGGKSQVEEKKKCDKIHMKCIILITVDSSVVSGLSTWLCNCPPRLSLELVSLHLTLKYTYLVIYSAISM